MNDSLKIASDSSGAVKIVITILIHQYMLQLLLTHFKIAMK